jgi:hypothetical protein
MLDVVRVVGNGALHVDEQPGDLVVIAMDDTTGPALVELLLQVANDLVDELITRPKTTHDYWDKLPDGGEGDADSARRSRARRRSRRPAVSAAREPGGGRGGLLPVEAVDRTIASSARVVVADELVDRVLGELPALAKLGERERLLAAAQPARDLGTAGDGRSVGRGDRGRDGLDAWRRPGGAASGARQAL